MVEMPRFETSCLETGVKTLVTEMGQQLPPSKDCHYFLINLASGDTLILT